MRLLTMMTKPTPQDAPAWPEDLAAKEEEIREHRQHVADKRRELRGHTRRVLLTTELSSWTTAGNVEQWRQTKRDLEEAQFECDREEAFRTSHEVIGRRLERELDDLVCQEALKDVKAGWDAWCALAIEAAQCDRDSRWRRFAIRANDVATRCGRWFDKYGSRPAGTGTGGLRVWMISGHRHRSECWPPLKPFTSAADLAAAIDSTLVQLER